MMVIHFSNYFQIFLFSEKLQHLFLANSISITDYKLFGDLVTFDTTYNTDKYNFFASSIFISSIFD